MNRIDFTKTGGILRSQDLLDFLQQSYIKLFQGLATMIGSNVIVAGVTDLGSTYSDGWVSIAGELIPFVGGTKAANIIIVETVGQESYGDGSNKDAYYTRVAQTASSGGTPISSFTRLSDLTQLSTKSYVDAAIANLVNSAPGALDTLKELADALGDDANFAATMTTALNSKLPKAGGTMTGPIAMGGNKVTGLAAATANGDAVRFEQLPTVGAWTTITLINGWAGASGDVPQYRVWSNGKVEFRGKADAGSATNQTLCAAISAIIPVGSGGACSRVFECGIVGSTTGNLLTISSSGVITLTGNGLSLVNDLSVASYYNQ